MTHFIPIHVHHETFQEIKSNNLTLNWSYATHQEYKSDYDFFSVYPKLSNDRGEESFDKLLLESLESLLTVTWHANFGKNDETIRSKIKISLNINTMTSASTELAKWLITAQHCFEWITYITNKLMTVERRNMILAEDSCTDLNVSFKSFCHYRAKSVLFIFS